MKVYVSPDSKNPIEDAIRLLNDSGYQKDADGREFYYEADDDGTSIRQVYCDGDEVVEWSDPTIGSVTPANRLEVSFTC